MSSREFTNYVYKCEKIQRLDTLTKHSKSDYITPLIDRVIHTENYEQELSNVFDDIGKLRKPKILEEL